jgi:hypothetical protein
MCWDKEGCPDLEFSTNLYIDLPWGQVIRYTILVVVEIADPGIRNGIINLKQVKDFGSYPKGFKTFKEPFLGLQRFASDNLLG